MSGFYNLNVTNIFSQNRKYDMARFMRYDEDSEMYDILDSKFIQKLPYINCTISKTVTFEEGQPALISELQYGYFVTQFWWIVLELNNLMGPDDMVTGTQLQLPQLSELDSVFAMLKPQNN